MTKEQYLLLLLAEECTEVGHRATKAIRFGLDTPEGTQPGEASNKERLLEELNDLLCIVEMLFKDGYINKEHHIRKREKIEKYLKLTNEIGYIEVKE